jgi:nucleoside-diphosphate-sugar epimerase
VGRLAFLTGAPGAVADAVAAALGASGLEVRRAPFGRDGAFELTGPVPAAYAVVHLGLRTSARDDERVRAHHEAAAAAAAAALARAAGARRLVHVSTAAVYGRPRNLPCREGELKAPRTAHERIRWRAEQASWSAFRKGAPLTVLRPAILYGASLRGGVVRAVALVALFNQRRRRVPILRRGPVAHLVHVEDLARAVAHVVSREDDREVVGRAFNVADDAPLPLAEHLAAALAALGYETGRVLPAFPRIAGAALWLLRHVPDRALLDRINARLAEAWGRVAADAAIDAALAPRVEREALHWMSADHYYDTSRLAALGWRPRHPDSSIAVASTIRALVAERLLPGSGGGVFPVW